MRYFYLLVAVLFEIFGTSSLQASQQFTKIIPSISVLVGFAGALYFLTLALKYMPLGVVYAVWSGLGIIFIAAIGVLWYKQPLDLPAMIGLVLIIVGICVIQLFSDTAVH